MYLVELRPGKEELYRSVDELAAAIRRGDVDAHSRIFHRATSKWISITLHPQFKAISAEKAPAPHSDWSLLNSAAEELDAGADEGPAALSTTEVAVAEAFPDASSETLADAEATREDPKRSWRRPFAFGFAGLLLLIGALLAVSAAKPAIDGIGRMAKAAVRKVHPTPTVASTASFGGMPAELTPVGYPMPRSSEVSVPAPAARSLPPAPVMELPDVTVPPGLDDVDSIRAPSTTTAP